MNPESNLLLPTTDDRQPGSLVHRGGWSWRRRRPSGGPKSMRLLLALLCPSLFRSSVESFTIRARTATRGSPPRVQATSSSEGAEVHQVDIAIVGSGIGGLCAGAILNTLYNKKVAVYESHYLPGGCAHAFDRGAKTGNSTTTFRFDSGPTIVLGCSKKPFNPLQQVLRAVGVDHHVHWIPYDGWGMIEHPGGKINKERRWKLQVGPGHFERGPLAQFASSSALDEFEELRRVTAPLVTGAAEIPAMAMRPGDTALVPLLRYLPPLFKIISNGVEASTGPFKPYIDGPLFTVKDKWLRDWLDALAFSLSGLPAARTSAGAMAYVLFRYAQGRCCSGLPQGEDGSRATGLTVRKPNGETISVMANDGVICNAPVWSLRNLIKNSNALSKLNGGDSSSVRVNPVQSWMTPDKAEPSSGRGSVLRPRQESQREDETSLLEKCDGAELTGSFLHLHVALDAKGLDLDLLEPHYTVMDRGLEGDDMVIDGVPDDACGELNMIALSNPCVLDKSLSPEGYVILHAYGAANEPYDGVWADGTGSDATIGEGGTPQETNGRYSSSSYEALKSARAAPLWRAVESIIPDARERTVLALLGSPKTHERYLRRPKGSFRGLPEGWEHADPQSPPVRRWRLPGHRNPERRAERSERRERNDLRPRALARGGRLGHHARDLIVAHVVLEGRPRPLRVVDRASERDVFPVDALHEGRPALSPPVARRDLRPERQHRLSVLHVQGPEDRAQRRLPVRPRQDPNDVRPDRVAGRHAVDRVGEHPPVVRHGPPVLEPVLRYAQLPELRPEVREGAPLEELGAPDDRRDRLRVAHVLGDHAVERHEVRVGEAEEAEEGDEGEDGPPLPARPRASGLWTGRGTTRRGAPGSRCGLATTWCANSKPLDSSFVLYWTLRTLSGSGSFDGWGATHFCPEDPAFYEWFSTLKRGWAGGCGAAGAAAPAERRPVTVEASQILDTMTEE
ncbi:hypothetical protein THAOC_10830 [Thalassiosira oceanica]|uniref:Amine oxidase domain-containing protein n=1 Tax=Thalassiosira oceanica TaxID=159749 RepID=K0TC06_THAOC|nr:hypothetical protein THAOC_10830 [Thalassiosira oceanica]|eukprot:EJK68037.1 hypothetical protein THAOC_10830 [Thalassiosira oceanica]